MIIDKRQVALPKSWNHIPKLSSGRDNQMIRNDGIPIKCIHYNAWMTLYQLYNSLQLQSNERVKGFFLHHSLICSLLIENLWRVLTFKLMILDVGLRN
jgi:hypothetical protein